MEARSGPYDSPVGCLEPRSADLVNNLAPNRLASCSPVCARLGLEGADRIDDVRFCIWQRRADFGLGVRTHYVSRPIKFKLRYHRRAVSPMLEPLIRRRYLG